MTDSVSARLSWYQAPTWDLRPIFSHSLVDYFFYSFVFVNMGKKSGLYFSVFAGHRRRSLSQV
jgi:hypothetical protein